MLYVCRVVTCNPFFSERTKEVYLGGDQYSTFTIFSGIFDFIHMPPGKATEQALLNESEQSLLDKR